MKRTLPIALAVAAALTAVAIAGCTTPPSTVAPGGSTGNPAAGGGPSGATRIAPGLYDMPDGTVQAVGTLAWRDLEGGFWAVVGGAGGSSDTVLAVLAGSGKDDPAYTALAGQPVLVVGTRVEGVSVRMAGPEIKVTSIKAFTDVNGPAQ